jgi:hypothetical protein
MENEERATDTSMQMVRQRTTSDVGRAAVEMVYLIVGSLGIGLLGLIAYGVWLVRAYLPYLGIAALIACLIVILSILAWPVIWVMKAAKNMGHTHIGEFGTVVNTLFGRRLYSPMTANAVKVTRYRNRVKVQQEVPTIMELIESGVIAVGQMIMHMGFEMGKGGLIPVLDKWPGSFAIPGQGRSGKTRRATSIIFQAILAGAKVIVLDPHSNKPDGIAKLLAPLDRWITIVRGEENCAAAAKGFLNEMERRVSDQNGGPWKPWFILIDEWSRLMINLNDEDKEMLIGLVRDCSTQYAGYDGYAGIIGHIWTEKESGGTVIRRTLHHAFVHRLNSEYAKFFLSGKWARRAEELSMRECIYKEGPVYKIVLSITVPDGAPEWFASWLEEHLPPEMIANDPVPFAVPGAQNYTPMIEAPKPSPRMDFDTPDEHEIVVGENVETNENVGRKRVDTGELFPLSGGIVENTENTENEGYTLEEERKVLEAILSLTRQNIKLTRTAIRDECGWHGREFSRVVKPVCDKFKIGIKE